MCTKTLCIPTKTKPVKLWEDSGAAGGRSGSVWVINSMGLVAIVEGHQEPTGEFFELNLKNAVIQLGVHDIAMISEKPAENTASKPASAAGSTGNKNAASTKAPAIDISLLVGDAERPSLVVEEYTPPPPKKRVKEIIPLQPLLQKASSSEQQVQQPQQPQPQKRPRPPPPLPSGSSSTSLI